MKRIEKLQIAGHSFFVEDDAYVLLEKFIAQIQQLYEDNGGDLKVAETESRIATMCCEKVGENGIVTATIIEDVIAGIGVNVEKLGSVNGKQNEKADDTSAGNGAAAGCEENGSTWYKAMLKGSKLYRNKHNGILGGVLSGIAMYYNIDVLALRIITLVLFFLPLNIPVVLAYVILWIALPKAVTIMDYTRMRRVMEKGDSASVEKAWKNNYEQAVAELSVPSTKGCLYSLVRVLFFILIAVALLPLSVVVLVLFFALLLFVVAGWGVFEAFNIPFMIALGLVVLITVPVFLLLHFILKKANVCSPMKRNTKLFFVALWVITLLLVAPAVNRYGGYRNIDNIMEYQWKKMKLLFSGDIENIALMSGYVNYSSSSRYNTRPVDADCDAVVYSLWDADYETAELPLIVESIHKSNGIHEVAFYTHGENFMDTQEKLLDGACDAKVTVNMMPLDDFYGYHCFAWDSISGTLYYGEIKYGDVTLKGCAAEELTSRIKLRTFGSTDSLQCSNARDKGLVPFRIQYCGNRATPSFLIADTAGGKWLEPTAVSVRLKGTYNAEHDDDHDINIRVDKNAIDRIDNLVDDISDKVDEIVDVCTKAVDID